MARWTLDWLGALRHALPPYGDGTPPASELEAFCAEFGLLPERDLPAVRLRCGRIESAGLPLAVHGWTVEGATHNLLLVHGYFDHSGLYGKLVDFGLRQRCNVLIFDLPGHGLSGGESCVIDDFAEYGRAVADVLQAGDMPPLPWRVIAQSMGAAALVEFARQHRWPFQATVLLAPLVRPAGWLRVSASHTLLRRFVARVRRDFAENSSDVEFLAFVRNDPLQSSSIPVRWVGALRRWLKSLPPGDLGVGPALLVQGDADRTVDWRYNLPVVERLCPGSRVEHIPGAGHQLANESEALREQYYALVSEYFAACSTQV